jgi:hypothetical protein
MKIAKEGIRTRQDSDQVAGQAGWAWYLWPLNIAAISSGEVRGGEDCCLLLLTGGEDNGEQHVVR